MKRHELIKHLKQEGCKYIREGKKHTVYWNPSNLKSSVVPRHTEISNKLARKICKDLGISQP